MINKENIKKYTENIIELIGSSLPIKKVEIKESSKEEHERFIYYVHIYFAKEANNKKIKDLEEILDLIFEKYFERLNNKKPVGFILHDFKGDWYPRV